VSVFGLLISDLGNYYNEYFRKEITSVIGDPSNLPQYFDYLRSFQPYISPRAIENIKFVIRKGVRPGTQTTQSFALPVWPNPRGEMVIDWAAFYADIGFPAFIYVAGYNPLIQDWE